MPISEREFDLAIGRIEDAISSGTSRLESLFKDFDARLRAAEKSTSVQMWFWRIAGGIGLAVLGAWLSLKP